MRILGTGMGWEDHLPAKHERSAVFGKGVFPASSRFLSLSSSYTYEFEIGKNREKGRSFSKGICRAKNSDPKKRLAVCKRARVFLY
jgi:hypothetical protein